MMAEKHGFPSPELPELSPKAIKVKISNIIGLISLDNCAL